MEGYQFGYNDVQAQESPGAAQAMASLVVAERLEKIVDVLERLESIMMAISRKVG